MSDLKRIDKTVRQALKMPKDTAVEDMALTMDLDRFVETVLKPRCKQVARMIEFDALIERHEASMTKKRGKKNVR